MRPKRTCRRGLRLLTEPDRQEVESLFRRYGKGVGSYVLTRTRNRELAESITASVFLIVVRRFDQCQGNRVAWLWSIVRTELARHFRDQKPHGPLGADIQDPGAGPTSRIEETEMSGRVRAALEQLGEPSHSLIYLKFFLDMSNSDIAEVLEMTAANVGVTCHRAVNRMRELMNQEQPTAV